MSLCPASHVVSFCTAEPRYTPTSFPRSLPGWSLALRVELPVIETGSSSLLSQALNRCRNLSSPLAGTRLLPTTSPGQLVPAYFLPRTAKPRCAARDVLAGDRSAVSASGSCVRGGPLGLIPLLSCPAAGWAPCGPRTYRVQPRVDPLSVLPRLCRARGRKPRKSLSDPRSTTSLAPTARSRQAQRQNLCQSFQKECCPHPCCLRQRQPHWR